MKKKPKPESNLIPLSPTKLNLLADCAACFYRMMKMDWARPRGMFATLPNGMDSRFKALYDQQRIEGLMPGELLLAELEGWALFHDIDDLKKWRHWKSGLKVERNGWLLQGAIDDVLYNQKLNAYAPWDYKTKAKATTQAALEKYYQRQLDLYTLMFHENGYATRGFGVITSFYPVEAAPAEQQGQLDVKFQAETFILQTDIHRALSLCDQAEEVLSLAECPESEPTCEHCQYLSRVAQA